MKSRTCYLSLVAASLGLAHTALAEYYMGQSVVYGVAEVTATYDSNIYTNNMEESDLIFALAPGVQYIRDAGYIRAEAEAGLVIERFQDNDQFDTENPYGVFTLTMPFRDEDYPLAFRARGEARKESLSDATVNDHVERSVAIISGRADYRIHNRFIVWGEVGGETYDYEITRYADSDIFAIEAGSGYRYSSRLNMGLSTRVRWTDRDNWGATDYAFFGVVEGQILPRTTGTISIGVQHRDYDTGLIEDEWSPFVRATVEWEQDSNTRWQITATSDFMSTAATESTSKKGLSLRLRQGLIAKIDAFAGATFEHLELDSPGATNRDDDLWRFDVGADYTLTELFALHGQLSWENRDSSANYATFDRTVASVAFSARF